MWTPPPTVVSSTCTTVLAHDFPGLPTDRRRIVADFVASRLAVLPGPMRLGVTIIAHLIGALGTIGGERAVVRVSSLPLPLVGEYFRLLRSLSYAYVWETWPDTAPSGEPIGRPS